MKPTTQMSAQIKQGFFRRLARRFCQARMEYVRRELQRQGHFLDAVGGRIEPVQASGDGGPQIVLAFEPRLGTAKTSGLAPQRHGMPNPSHSTIAEADVIPFRADKQDDYRHRMFENLVAAVWVGTLMTSAYYVFSQLLAQS